MSMCPRGWGETRVGGTRGGVRVSRELPFKHSTDQQQPTRGVVNFLDPGVREGK